MGVDPLTQGDLLISKRRAVFLDRDGVINHNWFNPKTGAWESPIHSSQLRLCDGALEGLLKIQGMGYLLFLISNQPSAAKAKCSIADLQEVHMAFSSALEKAGVHFTRFFYAYGHPEAVVPKLRDTRGRKPDPYFIQATIDAFGIRADRSWMIGDRDSDIECGQRGGVRTIQVRAPEPDGKSGKANPDFRACDLAAAATLIDGNDKENLLPFM